MPFAELGITRNDFLEVLYEFGADLSGLPTSGFEVAISPRVVESLLAEVADDTQKLAMLRLIFDVIRSDGELAPGRGALVLERAGCLERCASRMAGAMPPRTSSGTFRARAGAPPDARPAVAGGRRVWYARALPPAAGLPAAVSHSHGLPHAYRNPQAIFLKDYIPPAWWVDTVELHVALHDDHADVRAPPRLPAQPGESAAGHGARRRRADAAGSRR
jgi:hypothetical protein